MDNEKKTNRLIHEKSPYLQQHAHNPVNWYPWGEEAFEDARKMDKPVFLSIGYSSCHWCHVMREESFEDESVAEMINEHFIPIKVDREERPDVDHVYMSFCQAMTGQGGWPMNILMTSDGKPFYAVTYLPKNPPPGHMGIRDLISNISALWRNERSKILSAAENAVQVVSETVSEYQEGEISPEVFEKCFMTLKEAFDPIYGGFNKAPKFPTPQHLLFLLRYWKKEKDPVAMEIAEKTLMGMYKGGIYDHVGFGFSRYSVDEKWLVPHFEKMLYDNALLIKVYAECYAATGRELYREIAEDTMEYVLREMTADQGGFFSAEDADSEGEEGKYYLFAKEEVLSVLGEKDGTWFASYFGITDEGNFEGKNIINLIDQDLPDLPTEDLNERRKAMVKKLLEYREKRVKPGKDDKILSSWNGLMIGAFAYAGKVFQEEHFIRHAEGALHFIMERMMDEKGSLYASYRNGRGTQKGFLESYAYLCYGALSLHEATLDNGYLRFASELADRMINDFLDEKDGVFRMNSSDHDRLVMVAKDVYDSALPSGNSMAAVALSKLWSITGKNEYRDIVTRLFGTLGGAIMKDPQGFTYLLTGYMTLVEGPKEVVLSGKKDDETLLEMKKYLSVQYLPDFTFTVHSPDHKEQDEELFTLWRVMEDGKTTAYVCENFMCHLGVQEISELQKRIETDD